MFRELTFLHLFLVPKSILVFWKIEQLSNKTIRTLMKSIKSSLLQILHKTSKDN